MGVQSVSRVIDILHLFRPDMPLLGVVEISRQLGLDRSAVQRVIASLLEGDLVEQDPVSGKYRLGLGLLELAGTMLQGHNMPRVVQPFLRELADLVGECARLDLLYQGNSALQIAEATSANLIGYSDWTGRRLPLDCTASGRVLLAQMESKLLDETLGTLDLRARTAKTITNPDELCRELQTVRQQGYSITLGEFLDGVHAVAAPVAGPEAGIPVALTLVGPAYRFSEEKVKASISPLLAVANDMSCRLPRSLFGR